MVLITQKETLSDEDLIKRAQTADRNASLRWSDEINTMVEKWATLTAVRRALPASDPSPNVTTPGTTRTAGPKRLLRPLDLALYLERDVQDEVLRLG